MADIIYDIECYPNIWTLMASPCDDDNTYYLFEISPRVNDIHRLFEFIRWCQFNTHRMVGFNNIGYDYPLLHWILNVDANRFSQSQLYEIIYQKSNSIITTPWENRFSNMIYVNKEIVPQVDLFKIHHFDNVNRRTSLKLLEINMRLKSVQNLPFPPGTVLSLEQMLILVSYNKDDVYATKMFYHESLDKIKFRDGLTKKYNRDFTNHNDTKIGKDYLVMELEKRLGPNCCYTKPAFKPRITKQTIYDKLKLGELIFPIIKFRTKQFNEILDFFKKTETSETKGVFEKLSCIFPSGLECVFGMGGIHAFNKPMHAQSCKKYAIIDLDAKSYYPSLGIVNRLFPAHLSEVFCDIMSELKSQREQYEKGTSQNAMLKLSLTGSWGSTNDSWSPFYDKRYAMQITINGQLLLCMLAEMIMLIPDTMILQMNTDGLTIKIPRTLEPMLKSCKKDWEKLTGLILESQYYTDMYLKNVNGYLAVDVLGEIKRKKNYNYIKDWHQNHSMLVVPKAAEAHLIRGVDIETFLLNHEDDFDFCLSIRMKKPWVLRWGDSQVQGTSRYYISKTGKSLARTGPELTRVTRKKQEILKSEIAQGRTGKGLFKLTKSGDPVPLTPVPRKIGSNVKWKTTICNDGVIDRSNIDYAFYIEEVKKLTDGVK